MCGRREGSRATAGRPEGCSVNQTNKQTNKQAGECGARARQRRVATLRRAVKSRCRCGRGCPDRDRECGDGCSAAAVYSAQVKDHARASRTQARALRRWTTLDCFARDTAARGDSGSNATPCRMGFCGLHAAWDSVAYADITGHGPTGPDEHLPVQDDDRRALEHRPLAELERVQPAAVVHLWEGGWKQMRSRGTATCVCERTRPGARACMCARVCACVCLCVTAST